LAGIVVAQVDLVLGLVECELHSRIGRIAAQVVNQNNRRWSSHKTEDPDLKSHAQAGSLRVAPIGGTDEQSFHLAGQLSGGSLIRRATVR
jgi:hypothetical protein